VLNQVNAMHLVQEVMSIQLPSFSRRLLIILIATHLAFTARTSTHAFVLPHQYKHHHHQQHQQRQQTKHQFPSLIKTDRTFHRRQHILNQSKREGIKRILRQRSRSNTTGSSTTKYVIVMSAAGITIFLTSGIVQRVAASVASYCTAKNTYELFERLFSSSSGHGEKKRNRLKNKFQKYKQVNKRNRAKPKIKIIKEASGTSPQRGMENDQFSNSNPSGKAWLKQSLDNLEETDRAIADLKRQEAAARAAEQKAKAKLWVSDTLRSTADAKLKAEMMIKKEKEDRHKAQKWAESIAKQSGIDLT
jgi:hypothetical protein